MKALVAFLLLTSLASADVNVRGYSTKSGKVVMPHVRTSPNRQRIDNYSAKSNVNPTNGRVGYKDTIKPRFSRTK